MKKRVLAVVMCALMAGSVFTGFKDAGDDKELVLFTWEGMFPQEVLDDFEKETGVKVVYSNFDTDETMLEKLSMAKGGDYDIVIADDYILETAIQEGLAEKLERILWRISGISTHYIRDSSMIRMMNTQFLTEQVSR